jgi:hypothetical protein
LFILTVTVILSVSKGSQSPFAQALEEETVGTLQGRLCWEEHTIWVSTKPLLAGVCPLPFLYTCMIRAKKGVEGGWTGKIL